MVQTVHGRHWQTGQPIAVHCDAGQVRAVEPSSDRDANDRWLAPALVDLQINGFAGIDFQQDDLTIGDWLKASRGLQAAGCGRWLATFITDEWSILLRRVTAARSIRDQEPELRSSIAGWHIEGPFLSSEPGYCGAHNSFLMRDPTADDLRALRKAAGEDPVLLTMSPERTGVLEAIGVARSLGITVSLGHTNAGVERLRMAVQAGARGFTHLGNGCPAELNRHDNILWRVMEMEGLHVSVIPDAIHVSPPLFRLLHRVVRSIYYTTDAMAAAGAPPGKYRLGRMELEVGSDQVVRRPGSALFAGSALTPIEGIRRAARMLSRSWRDVWDKFSLAPCRLMGWPEPFTPGSRADLCIVRTSLEGDVSGVELVRV